jgi:hypothetical protein
MSVTHPTEDWQPPAAPTSPQYPMPPQPYWPPPQTGSAQYQLPPPYYQPAPPYQPAPIVYAVKPPRSTNATISLVMGIVGLALSVCTFGVPSAAAVITGHLALRETNRDPVLRGRNFAIWGMVLGYPVALFWLIGGLGYLGNRIFGG